jgi:hypothetical protein
LRHDRNSDHKYLRRDAWKAQTKGAPHPAHKSADVRLKAALLSRPIRIVYRVATDFAVLRVKRELASLGLRRVKITVVRTENINNMPFTPSGAWHWDSPSERRETGEFLSDVGSLILARSAERKQWNYVRRRERSLGFSDQQRLVVFSVQCTQDNCGDPEVGSAQVTGAGSKLAANEWPKPAA